MAAACGWPRCHARSIEGAAEETRSSYPIGLHRSVHRLTTASHFTKGGTRVGVILADFAKKRLTVQGLHEIVIGTGLDGLLDVLRRYPRLISAPVNTNRSTQTGRYAPGSGANMC